MASEAIRRAWHNTCPNCGKGALFQSRLKMVETCEVCGFDLSVLDAGDGPASLLVLFYGALIVPLAFLAESLFAPPLWAQAVFWGAVMLVLTLKTLRPIKTLMIGWQFRHFDAEKRFF